MRARSDLSVTTTLARRFLFSKRSDGFISLITWVSVAGVTLGVLALIVVTSVINGFETELSNVVSRMNGDVILYTRGVAIESPQSVEKKIRKILPQTKAITTSFVTEFMVSGPDGVAGAVMEGVDLETVGNVTEIPKRVIQGGLPSVLPPENGELFEIAMGKALAERIGAKVSSVIRLIIPFSNQNLRDETGELTNVPRVAQAKVVGLVQMGMHEYDSKFVFANIRDVQKFLDQSGKVTSFKLKLPEGSNLYLAAKDLRDNFGYPFRAKDWTQLNQNLFYAVQLEKAVIAVILTAIIIVAAFNVVSTLMMMIHDKGKEIAILKAMGLKPIQSFQIFCLIGTGIGLVGTGIGVGLGLGVNWILRRFDVIDLPAEVYYIELWPVLERWSEIGLIIFFAVLICFVATFYPSFRVSKKSPVEGLRYD